MKINFKNNPAYRSTRIVEKKQTDSSLLPQHVFTQQIIMENGDPIPVWAIPVMGSKHTAIFGLFDGRLIKYDIVNKTFSSLLKFADRIYSSPIISDNKKLLIAASDSGEVAALDIHTWTVKWKKKLPKAIHSSPTYEQEQEVLYIGCYDNSLYALEMQSGQILCRKKLEKDVDEDPYSSPIVLGDRVYIGTGNKLVSLSQDLQLLWEVELGSFIDSSPALSLDTKTGIVGSEKGEIILFNIYNGSILNEWKTDFRITCSAAISKNEIACIGNDKGEAYGINLKTGKILWVKNFDAAFRYTAITCTLDNNFIFTLNDGIIRCVDDLSGNECWALSDSYKYHTPPLLTQDGFLFCGSHFGYISGYVFSDERLK